MPRETAAVPLGGALRGRWLLAAGLLASLGFCMTPVFDPDLAWHLSAGRYIVEQRRVPDRDFLSWSKEGQPWIDFEWGTEVLFEFLDRLAGVRALWLFKVLACAALMAGLTLLLRLWRLPDSWIGAALPPFTLSLLPFIDARPELVSLVLCMAELYVLEAARLGESRLNRRVLLVLHVPLYAVWANAHAGFPVGLALCLLYGGAEAIGGKKERLGLALFAAGVLGSLANPAGPRLYLIFIDHWRQMALLRRYITDWAPPDISQIQHGVFWLVSLFCVAVFGLDLTGERRVPPEHYVTAAAFALLSWRFSRQGAYFPLTVFPMALRALWTEKAPRWWPRWQPLALGCVIAVLTPLGYGELRQQRIFSGIDETHWRDLGPSAGFLKRNKSVLSGLRMFCFPLSGGPLEHDLYPDYKTFMDGRYIFTDYFPLISRISSTPRAWREFMDSADIGLVYLDYPLTFMIKDHVAGAEVWRPADVYSLPARDWALIYWDGHARIWVKRSAVAGGWLKAREFRFIHPRDLGFLSAGVRAGAIPMKEVLPEVWRYVREIGDRGESERLIRWIHETSD